MTDHFPQIGFYRGQDSRRLAFRRWQNVNPVADVVYLHGIVSHSGWYESSCRHLAENNFQVHFLDRRGSGLNQSDRGDVSDWNAWIEDVRIYLDQLPKDRPRILLGISWGGILAAALARRHPDLINGLGLVCPGLYSRKAATRAQQLGIHLANRIGVGQRRVEVPLQDPALFTNSPESQRYIAEDPLTLRRITLRFAKHNLALLRYAVEAPESIETPMLLMLASLDPICDNDATRSFAARVGSSDQTIIEYHGASHTLEFESNPSQYFADLTAWCERLSESETIKRVESK